MNDDTGIDVLDPRFPISLIMPASIFWDMAHQRPDRAALAGLAKRARADEVLLQARYVTPRWVPAAAREDTAVDMQLPRGWYRDTPTREGMPQPEDAETFIAVSDLAEAAEAEAAERRPWRRVLARLTNTKGEQ